MIAWSRCCPSVCREVMLFPSWLYDAPCRLLLLIWWAGCFFSQSAWHWLHSHNVNLLVFLLARRWLATCLATVGQLDGGDQPMRKIHSIGSFPLYHLVWEFCPAGILRDCTTGKLVALFNKASKIDWMYMSHVTREQISISTSSVLMILSHSVALIKGTSIFSSKEKPYACLPSHVGTCWCGTSCCYWKHTLHH